MTKPTLRPQTHPTLLVTERRGHIVGLIDSREGRKQEGVKAIDKGGDVAEDDGVDGPNSEEDIFDCVQNWSRAAGSHDASKTGETFVKKAKCLV